MKKQLLLLIVPILLSIFGVIYFQIDWMIKTYDTEFDQINARAQNALNYALIDFDRVNQDSLRADLMPKLTALVDSVELRFSNDSLIINLEMRENPPLDPEAETANRNEVPVGRLSMPIGKIRVHFPSVRNYKERSLTNQADRKLLTGQFLILQRRIFEMFPRTAKECEPLYFKDDSARISDNFKKHLSNQGLGGMTDLTQLVFFCDSNAPLDRPMALGTSLMRYKAKGLEGYSSNTRWVGAYFHDHTQMIVSQMIVPVLLSILMILIMVVCFIYLIKTILKQKRIAEMKDNYVNNMTHELKTPVATVSAAIEGMKRFKVLEDKEKTQRYLDAASTELHRLNNLITKILNISIYDRDEIEMVLQEVDLGKLIHEAAEAEQLRETKTIQFQLDVADNLPSVHADPVHFRNVLTNLIDNAVKYSGEAVEISISCYQQQDRVYIKIRDNGMGIPSGQLKHIFDRFFRVSTGNVHNVKGYGLGLHYARYIIERHGGEISVDSQVNKGTEFILYLPFK